VNPPALGPGEKLDKTILFNCLGGRFSPGIEMTFIVRDRNLYQRDWRNSNAGPFRINRQALDYHRATPDQPFLGVGYIPLRDAPVQPGDLSKFMAIPWHTDYNSCATHPLDGEDENKLDVNNLLYASWPAQRPVAVYTYDDVQANEGQLARPRFSVRGAGTASPDASNVGRYQNRVDILLNWSRVGVVMQGPAIVGYPAPDLNNPPAYSPNFFLEVQSQFGTDESNLAEYWRNTVLDRLYPPPPPPKKKP
jgi:L-lysine epsilon oxidase C-terminal domain